MGPTDDENSGCASCVGLLDSVIRPPEDRRGLLAIVSLEFGRLKLKAGRYVDIVGRGSAVSVH